MPQYHHHHRKDKGHSSRPGTGTSGHHPDDNHPYMNKLPGIAGGATATEDQLASLHVIAIEDLDPELREEHGRVAFSLADMRKSHVGLTRVEKEQERLEMACTVRLNDAKKPKKTSKKNNKITHCKVLTREQEQKKVVAQEFRKFLAMVDDNCHKNKTFEELQKQAAASYALTLTNGKFKRESAKIGIPKEIYVELIADIVKEGDARRQMVSARQHGSRSPSPEGKSNGNGNGKVKGKVGAKRGKKGLKGGRKGLNRGNNNTGTGTLNNNEIAEDELLPPLSSMDTSAVKNQNEGLFQGVDFHTPVKNKIRPQSASARVTANAGTLSLKDRLRDEALAARSNNSPGRSPSPSRSRSPSPTRDRERDSGALTPLRSTNKKLANTLTQTHTNTHTRRKTPMKHQQSPQALKREQMFKEREDRLLDVIYQRENSHQIKKDKKDREVRQRMFLVFVSHLSRMQAFSNLYYGEIKPERDRKAEEYLKNMKLKACQLIEKWWFTKRLDIVLKRNPKVRQVLASVFRRCWFVRFQIKARNGVKQIKRFIKDCSGSDKVKKVYFYRAKIIRIQRWFREWFSIQEARMQILWEAVDSIGLRRLKASVREAKADENRALKATATDEKFGQLLYFMDKQQKTIKEVQAEAAKEATKEANRIRHLEEVKERLKEVAEDAANDTSTNDKNSNKFNAGGHKHASTKDRKGYHKKKRTWSQKMRNSKNPTYRDKFNMLRELLKTQRMRHILQYSSQRANFKAGAKVPKVALDQMKKFLSLSVKPDENFNVYEQEEEGAIVSTGPVAPPFLLYSKGALQGFREAPLAFFKKYRT